MSEWEGVNRIQYTNRIIEKWLANVSEYIGVGVCPSACVSTEQFAAIEGRKLKYEAYAAVIATLDSNSDVAK